MKHHPNAVTINPYFKIHAGQLEDVKASLPRFVARTASEPKCIFYGFTMRGDQLFCQEAYEDADGALAHLGNVGELLAELLKIADLVRLEIHGPTDELRKLEGPLAQLNPLYFTYQCGLE
jgi:hypothetical protein